MITRVVICPNTTRALFEAEVDARELGGIVRHDGVVEFFDGVHTWYMSVYRATYMLRGLQLKKVRWVDVEHMNPYHYREAQENVRSVSV